MTKMSIAEIPTKVSLVSLQLSHQENSYVKYLESTQLTHNVFKTLLESCAELFVGQMLQQPYSNVSPNIFRVAMKVSNIKRCYNVAATLFSGNIQRLSNVIWQHFPHFHSKLPPQRCGNAHVTFLDYVFTTFTQCCGKVDTTLNC